MKGTCKSCGGSLEAAPLNDGYCCGTCREKGPQNEFWGALGAMVGWATFVALAFLLAAAL